MSINLELIKIVNDTLAKLPPAARAKIEGFWRSQGVQEHEGTLIPPVFKLADLGKSSTCAETDGVIFNFRRAFVEQAPETILQICIAHELAHAYRATEFDMPLNDATAYGYTSHDKEEDEAHTLIAEWGFDHYALIAWIEQNKCKLGL
jgi:hypothetical protein